MKNETEIKARIYDAQQYIRMFESEMTNEQHHGKLMEIKQLEWVLEQ